MKDVEILRQSIRAVTQILTESDVRVTQQGLDAYTKCDPRTGKITQINLPYLPDDASEELIQAVQGYLDHEVGHALFTDFSVAGTVTDDLTKQLHNIVEDAFVERKMVTKFRGCAYNLGNVSNFYREKYLNKVLVGGDEDEIKRSLIVAAIRAFSGQESYADYMSDKWHHIKEFKDKVEPLSAMLSATKSTADCLKAAQAIKEAITEKKPSSPPPPSESEPDEEGDQSTESNEPTEQSESEKGNSDEPKDDDSGSEKSDDDESAEQPETEADDDESENSSNGSSENADVGKDEDESESDENQDDEKKSSEESSDHSNEEDEGEEENSDEADDDEGGSTNSSEEESDSDSESENQDDQSEAEDDSGSEEGESAISELIKGGLNGEFGESLASEVADQAQYSEYLIFTDEYDKIGLYEEIGFGELASDKVISKFEDTVNHMVSPIQKEIERAICARSASTHTGGFRSGKLHSSALSRLAVNDDRIFRRKQVNTTKDVAVSLVVDCSGSMGGEKIRLAAYSAYTLSSVLDRLNINHEVIGFTTNHLAYEVRAEMSKQQMERGVRYARGEIIVMPIFKTFNEKMSHKVKSRLASLHHGDLGSNVDGESVAIAAKRLMAQKEKGKIMIVLSDGMPAVGGGIDIAPHLEQTVKRIEASGVNIVGIGIQSHAVERFYSKSIYVNEVSELPSVVGRQLKTMLLGSSR